MHLSECTLTDTFGRNLLILHVDLWFLILIRGKFFNFRYSFQYYRTLIEVLISINNQFIHKCFRISLKLLLYTLFSFENFFHFRLSINPLDYIVSQPWRFGIEFNKYQYYSFSLNANYTLFLCY